MKLHGHPSVRLHPHGRCVCCMLDQCFRQANLKELCRDPVFSEHFQEKLKKTQSKSQAEQRKMKQRGQPKAAPSVRKDTRAQ